MSRPYLCMDVKQRWLWMGGKPLNDPWLHHSQVSWPERWWKLTSDVERECRDAWEDAADRYEFKQSWWLI